MLENAFTCTGPYAILIMLGIKRVENRCVRPLPERGRCAVSCSKSFSKEEFGNFVQWASRVLPADEFERVPAWRDVKDWPGRMVGACDYVVRARNDLRLSADGTDGAAAWDEGYDYFWDLSNVVCFDSPISCRGSTGMWQMSPGLSVQVTLVDEHARATCGVGHWTGESEARHRTMDMRE